MEPIRIIQGGMGVGVSAWPLARTVSRLGQLGVVSSTGLPVLLARRLQAGDIGGHLRSALRAYPNREVGEKIIDRYFCENPKPPSQSYKNVSLPSISFDQELIELTVVANFVEVYLAKRGHDGLVGINLLEKIQIPTLPSLYGAMLAGVDYVLMGAGIPRTIPDILDRFARGEPAELHIDVAGASEDDARCRIRFDPADFNYCKAERLARPQFLAIVSSSTLAIALARKSQGHVDGFVVEHPNAGGHNAPPRGELQLNDRGEPIYGPRDKVDFAKIKELGRPFWIAGGVASHQGLQEAIEQGAEGIQVGTAFAFCDESGIALQLRARVLAEVERGTIDVRTDSLASPTGFPFKIVQLEGTLSDPEASQQRSCKCDLGFLRQPFVKTDGSIGYRCPAENPQLFVRKGGQIEETLGRKCLCNGLFATVGFGQVRKLHNTSQVTEEPPLITAGDAINDLRVFLPKLEEVNRSSALHYSAKDVVDRILRSDTPILHLRFGIRKRPYLNCVDASPSDAHSISIEPKSKHH